MTSQWLQSIGVDAKRCQRYQEAGWLKSISRGLWVRSGQSVTWQGAVQALQSQLDLAIWPAARSALELTGQAHYIPASSTPVIQLSLGAHQRLPAWFTRLPEMRWLQTLSGGELFGPEYAGLMDWHQGAIKMSISSPERALLELCYLLPDKADAEEVWQLMAGLTALRPDKVRQTLLLCRSIRAKRLFMVLAEASGHAWFADVDTEGVDFGSGKRSLGTGGSLHPRWQITVPEAWQHT